MPLLSEAMLGISAVQCSPLSVYCTNDLWPFYHSCLLLAARAFNRSDFINRLIVKRGD